MNPFQPRPWQSLSSLLQSRCRPFPPAAGAWGWGGTLVLALTVTAQAGQPQPDQPQTAPSQPAQPVVPAPARPGEPLPYFESGPGVLGMSQRTQRQQTIAGYASEPVALVAMALDSLRLEPVNKKTHVEVNLSSRVTFDGKGDKVSSGSRRVLDVLARILVDNPQTRVEVLVHTDGEGDAADRQGQSQGSAEAVRDYLVDKGVAAGRITPIGRAAEAPPLDPGARAPARQERGRSRRVELLIAPLG